MNTFLLLKVKAFILENPSQFDMSRWEGAKCCIAGLVCRVSGEKVSGVDEIRERAVQLLKISPSVSNELFYPALFDNVRAKSASETIDAFIANYD